jgi:hypothetical protein
MNCYICIFIHATCLLHVQFFTESALPLDAASLLLLSTGVPGARSGPAQAEPRRPGMLGKVAIYKSHM